MRAVGVALFAAAQKPGMQKAGREFYNRPMSVFALGLNHTTAPVDLRGRFALAPEQLAPALRGFRERLSRAREVAIVSTCNRTELYVGAEPSLVGPAVDWMAGLGGVSG